MRLFTILILLFTPSAFTMTHYFTAPFDTKLWHVDKPTKLMCRLYQSIPGYGEAAFSQENASEPTFILTSWQKVDSVTNANLSFLPPSWRYNESRQKVGNIAVRPGQHTILLQDKLTERLLLAMQNGLAPYFSYSHYGDRIHVGLSAVDFQTAYGKYLRCVGDLLEFSFEDVQKSMTFFANDNAELSDELKLHLRKIKDYMKADPAVQYIKVDGYADNLGRRGVNNYLSQKRADAVKNYLIAIGVPKDKVKINWHGSTKPLKDNETEAGRAYNRRVTIKMERL